MSQNDNIAPFIIKIQTALEKDGIDGAQRELDKLSKQTTKTTKTTKGLTVQTKAAGSATSQAAGMVGQLAQGLGASGGAAGKFGGQIGFAGAAVSGLTGGIGGLFAVMGAAALGAWLKYQNHVEAAKKKLEEHRLEVAANKLAIEQFANDKLSAYYNNVATAIDEVAAAQDRLNQARAAADSAEKADRMASITLAEKEEMNKLKLDDTDGQARTTSKFATQRRDLEQEYAQKDADRSLEKSIRDLNNTIEKSGVADSAEKRASLNAGSLDKNISELNDKINRLYTTDAPQKRLESAGGYNPSGLPLPGSGSTFVTDTEAQKKQADDLKKQRDELVTEFKRTIETQAAAIKQQDRLSVEVKALAIETEAAKKRMSTVAKTTPRINDATDFAEDRAVRDLAGKEKPAAKAKEDTRYQDALKNKENAVNTFKQGRKDQLSNSVLMELHQDIRQAEAEKVKIYRLIQADVKKSQQDIKNLQQSQRRAGSGG
ncbi:MAG: hypothetical protein PF904_10955 [Kiritimatiellae bacterium]|jgi:hypothetical protein|nr:hypothetical protein [Kiritimatiellia bacterium]